MNDDKGQQFEEHRVRSRVHGSGHDKYTLPTLFPQDAGNDFRRIRKELDSAGYHGDVEIQKRKVTTSPWQTVEKSTVEPKP